MVSDAGNDTLRRFMDIQDQLRDMLSKTNDILEHVRPKPAAPVPPRGEPNLDVARIEANQVLGDSLGEILMSAKIVLFIFMAAILVLGVLSIQNRKEVRRLAERLEAVERTVQEPRK